jgi:large subunit ribosomal protein L20
MPRVKGGPKTRRRKKKILKQAKGYVGRRGNLYKIARETVERGLVFAYRDRRVRKREFRSLWTIRINAAARLSELSYSQFMNGLKRAGVALDRKVLADLVVSDAAAFNQIAQLAKTHLAA